MTQEPQQPEVPPAPRPVSWMSLLRTVRAPLSVIVLAGIAVVLPPQSRDMLAALGDGDVVLSETVVFYLALAFLTFSGWYWSRALISARFDVPYTDEGRAQLEATETRLDFASTGRIAAFGWMPAIGFSGRSAETTPCAITSASGSTTSGRW